MAVARLLRSADFERTLGVPPRDRSVHFAVHHVAGRPGEAGMGARCRKLSTTVAALHAPAVDESAIAEHSGGCALWLGVVVPKRHARRSVTRSLLKRAIRASVARHAGQLARGLWVVRLRAPFDVAQFASAASSALGAVARSELESLLTRAAQRG